MDTIAVETVSDAILKLPRPCSVFRDTVSLDISFIINTVATTDSLGSQFSYDGSKGSKKLARWIERQRRWRVRRTHTDQLAGRPKLLSNNGNLIFLKAEVPVSKVNEPSPPISAGQKPAGPPTKLTMKPSFIAISIVLSSISFIVGTPVPESVLMARDGHPSLVIAGQLVSGNDEITKVVEKRVDTVVDFHENAWKDPREVERSLRTTLAVYASLVDAESKRVEQEVNDPERYVTKLKNLRHIVYSAIDVGTDVLCTALERRDKAGITEENGTKLIELFTRLAHKSINYPQWCLGTGDWAHIMQERLDTVKNLDLKWPICTAEDDKDGVKMTLKALELRIQHHPHDGHRQGGTWEGLINPTSIVP
ncbi:hypothetical protein H0H93_010623 [Arthromyces matolae]|nr:hypothetical protein H0H93_010623 [Arthromyces matolae]